MYKQATALNPILNEIASINRGLRGKNKRDLTKKLVESLMVTPAGFEPATFRAEI